MAARRALAYRIRSGSTQTEVSKLIYDVMRTTAFVRIDPKHPKTLVMDARYRFWIDHQTGGMPRVALASPPEHDPAAIRSSWYLVFQAAMLYGVPDSMLFEIHDQVYQGCRLPESTAPA